MSIAEKLTTIAQNEEKVFKAGKKAQYDEFWDNFQDNGKRTNYAYAFYGAGWRGSTFNPKYTISPSSGAEMFRFFNQDGAPNRGGTPIDIATILKNNNVTLDLSKLNSTAGRYLFYFSGISTLPELNMSGITNFQYCFRYSGIKSIEKLIVNETATFDQTFDSCTKLEHIIFEGTIGNDISFSSSQLLDKESIISVITALSETATGKTVTFSKIAVNNAFEIDVDDETTYPEGSEYYVLRNTKSNWTFSYV